MYASQLHRNLYDPFSLQAGIPSRRPDIKNQKDILLGLFFSDSLPSGRHPLNTEFREPSKSFFVHTSRTPSFTLPLEFLLAETLLFHLLAAKSIATVHISGHGIKVSCRAEKLIKCTELSRCRDV